MKTSAKLAIFLPIVSLCASAGLWAFQREPAVPVDGADAAHADRSLHLLTDAGQLDSRNGGGAESAGSGLNQRGRDRVATKREAADRAGNGDLKFHRRLGKSGEADVAPPMSPAPASGESLAGPVLAEKKPDSVKVAAAGMVNLPGGQTPIPSDAQSPEANIYAFGFGMARIPRWLGAGSQKSFPAPYISIKVQDRYEFSTINGLILDLIHNGPWHGGLIGTMMWGRSYSDLGSLSSRVPTLTNTLQGGVYLEYAVTKELSIGARLRHDIQGTGAGYGDIYADMDLPSPGLIDHSIRVSLEAMNQAAMNRYFGVAPDTAAALGTSAYRPGGGYSQLYVQYDLFLPTSRSTGVALDAAYGRLSKIAADSPLVRNFGSANQRSVMAAFVYHF